MTYHQMCNKSNTTGVTSGAGTVFPPGAPPVFSLVRVAQIFSFPCSIF